MPADFVDLLAVVMFTSYVLIEMNHALTHEKWCVAPVSIIQAAKALVIWKFWTITSSIFSVCIRTFTAFVGSPINLATTSVVVVVLPCSQLGSSFVTPSAFLGAFHHSGAWSGCAVKHIPFLDILWCPLHSWHSGFPPLPPPILLFAGSDIVVPRRFLLTLPEAMFEAIPEVEAAVLSTLGLLFVPAVGFDLSLAEPLISRYVLISRAISRGS